MTKTTPSTLLRSKKKHHLCLTKRLRRNYRIWVVVILGFIISVLLRSLALSFPEELARASSQVELWRNGVSQFQSRPDPKGESLSGYLRDECPKNAPDSNSECSCVVLLHGQDDTALDWKNVLLWPASEWANMRLGNSLRLLALSVPPSSEVKKQAERVHTVLSSLCPRWVVVGHDWGGWIATWLALNWPSDVKGLLLVEPLGLKRTSSTRLRSEESEFLDTHFATLSRPTLLLWGKEDAVLPMSIGYEIRSSIPSAIWREISHCGHWPHKDCPGPLVQSIIDLINFGTI